VIGSRLGPGTRLAILLLALAAIIAGVNALRGRRAEDPGERAYRLCGDCGLSQQKTEPLIETMRTSPRTREQELEAFRTTFASRAHAKLCETCAEAVLDASQSKGELDGPRSTP